MDGSIYRSFDILYVFPQKTAYIPIFSPIFQRPSNANQRILLWNLFIHISRMQDIQLNSEVLKCTGVGE